MPSVQSKMAKISKEVSELEEQRIEVEVDVRATARLIDEMASVEKAFLKKIDDLFDDSRRWFGTKEGHKEAWDAFTDSLPDKKDFDDITDNLLAVVKDFNGQIEDILSDIEDLKEELADIEDEFREQKE